MRDNKGQFTVKHGMVFTAEYRSWASMKSRCLNPDADHEAYRNVKICDRWINSFEDFYSDMGPKPTPKHSIERIDNKQGYYPGNCKWATQAEQNRNYSLNRVIEFAGKKLCVTDWAELTGIHRHRIYQRLNKGWSVEKTLTTPVKSV